MSNIETNSYDKVAREILDTGWFEDSKSDYNSMFFKHVTYSGELHVLDIGSHLGLWALRILEHSKNNSISTKMLCVDPCIDSTDSFESNTSEYSSLIEHFELAITDETENTLYIKHLEQNSLGSIQISPMIRNTIVDEMAVSGPPGPDLYPNEIVLGVAQTVTAQKIITEYSQNISPSSLNAVVCYACGYEYQILKSLNLRNRGVKIISCPSCARQGFEVINTVKILENKLSHIKTPITLSIIGCVVNGPGEAKETDIGLTGGGKGTHQIYVNGITDHIIKNENVADYIVNFVLKEIEQRKSIQLK